MPELPEVETIKRSLQKSIVGKKITGVQVLLVKQFQGKKEEVIGREILGIERRGKVLIVALGKKPDKEPATQRAQKTSVPSTKFSAFGVAGKIFGTEVVAVPEGTEKVLLIHFKLTGQLVWVPKAGERVTLGHPIPFAGTELPAKTTHVIFGIDGGRLFFNDLRQFGWIKVISDLSNLSDLRRLGPEPFDKEFTEDYLKQIFSKSAKPIKLVLMDQEKIAGIGNIYANDSLWEAGIRPDKPAKQLSDLAIEQLRKAIIRVLEDGLKYGGSSAADEAYIRPDATPGLYQEHFRVYQRDDQPCLRCGTRIQRVELGGRGTFYCPKCQR
ncbi:MAG: bifunctional DNA-formamidopyrimidine glycosylase/DNA-(apurinic or apyrimidinic site) lyase [Patescibacteria group bacterium]